MTDIAEIQRLIRAPKDKENDFGGYKYRNAEMILAAFKGLNVDGASLICTDSVQEVAGQIFVTATARLTLGNTVYEAQGHAMHPLQKKGMDASQITGSASSYARKYALCGLFAIEDESQDPDGHDNRQEAGQTKGPAPEAINSACDSLSNADRLERLRAIWSDLPKPVQKVARVQAAKNNRKTELDAMAAHGQFTREGWN